MARRSGLMGPLLASMLAACGGKAVQTLDADPAAGAGNAGGGMGGGSDAAACDFYDDDLGLSVRVVITNSTSRPLYFGPSNPGSCGGAPLFRVKDENGAELAPPSDCRSPCDVVAASGRELCPLICRQSDVSALQSGGIMLSTWSGLYSDVVDLPKHCVSAQGESRCERASVIQPGTFTFSVRAGTQLDCSQAIDEPCGPCVAGVDSCTIPGGLVSGQVRSAFASVMLDEEYGVFPSTRPQRQPASGPSARTVELVFSD